MKSQLAAKVFVTGQKIWGSSPITCRKIGNSDGRLSKRGKQRVTKTGSSSSNPVQVANFIIQILSIAEINEFF